MQTLHTARLHIRPLTLGDAPFILALLNDAGWLRFIGDKQVRSLADAERYLRDGPLAMYGEHGVGLCAVEVGGAAAPVALCGLLRRPGALPARAGSGGPG